MHIIITALLLIACGDKEEVAPETTEEAPAEETPAEPEAAAEPVEEDKAE